MPRKRTPGNERARADTERWRQRKRAAGSPEADRVDNALGVAVACFASAAVGSGKAEALMRLYALEKMAVNYLVAAGFDGKMAERDVRRRTRRLDVLRLIPLVNGVSTPAAPKATPKAS